MSAGLHIALYAGNRNQGRGKPFSAAGAFLFCRIVNLLGEVDYSVAVAVGKVFDKLGNVGRIVAGVNIESDCRKALNALAVAYNGDVFSHRFHAAFL